MTPSDNHLDSNQATNMQFKVSALLALVAFGVTILAVPVAEAEAEAAPVTNWKPRGPAPLAESALEERDADGNLVPRACSYTTGCRSKSGVKAGRYCGYCLQVSASHTWVGTHVYQLNGKTSASGCCDYGYSSTCAAQYNSNWSQSYCPF